MIEYSCLIFKVGEQLFAIGSDLIYRIERFEPSQVEYADNEPRFYRMGDFVITLDWLAPKHRINYLLQELSRVILYKKDTKVRAIPVTELNHVTIYTEHEFSVVPRFIKQYEILPWVNAFILDSESKQIIPLINPEQLQNIMTS